MKRRVVVTGLGAVTPVGLNWKEFWSGLLEGKNGIDRISRFDTSNFSVKIAGEVKGLDLSDRIPPKDLRRMDRFAQFAMIASIEAVEDSGLNLLQEDLNRVGVLIGSGIGGLETWEREYRKLMEGGPNRVSPFLIPMMMMNSASGLVSMRLGAKGPNFSTASACASSAHTIGEAYRIIERGDADVMITGGAEAPVTPLALAGFSNMKALSTRNSEPQKASRPFDRERDGFVMAEGSGICILEDLERSKKRRAEIYGEIVGFGLTADAYHITAPSPGGEGAARALKMALSQAELNGEGVDYINAHGTSTLLNDKLETEAIKTVFNTHAHKLAVSSTKSMTGHLMGGAGAIEFIVVTLAVKKDKIPPTINYEHPDPECDLDYVPNSAREIKVEAALTNALGFGGHNVVLAVKKFS
ncbi:beta-ketoacyl-ACP synthase II [candidate division TA06 bacterium]|nr:beta-ketoacyl-ACP synthase II [candidate division TA06 bacterium]